MDVMLAMSGGVDSSVAAYLLQQEGHTVTGVTFDTGVTPRERFDRDVADARSVAASLSMDHHVVGYADLFRREVLDAFIEAYRQGKTPNPCAVCNRCLKFGALLEYALSNGFEALATGHYARIVEWQGRRYLAKARDRRKDQSYFLYSVDPQLPIVFPLGGFTKGEIRAIASKLGLVTQEKRDSQEICFIEHDYRDFLEAYGHPLPGEGNFVDKDGRVLGRHKGIHAYTIGQRKGLEIALGVRAYVTEIRPDVDEVVLGVEEDLYRSVVRAKLPDGVSPPLLDEGIYEVKTRYTAEGGRARVVYRPETRMIEASFDPPVRAPAPGQSMVVYRDDVVITGGEILCEA